jgi:hypothetical protein
MMRNYIKSHPSKTRGADTDVALKEEVVKFLAGKGLVEIVNPDTDTTVDYDEDDKRDIINFLKSKGYEPVGYVERPQPPQPKDYGTRLDGTPKGPGYFGELQRPDGDISTELSIGIPGDKDDPFIPLLVPTLTREEIDRVLAGGKATPEMIQKARAHFSSHAYSARYRG